MDAAAFSGVPYPRVLSLGLPLGLSLKRRCLRLVCCAILEYLVKIERADIENALSPRDSNGLFSTSVSAPERRF